MAEEVKTIHEYMAAITFFGCFFAAAFLYRLILVPLLRRLAAKTSAKWDDVLADALAKPVFNLLLSLGVFWGVYSLPFVQPHISSAIHTAALRLIFLLFACHALLNARSNVFSLFGRAQSALPIHTGKALRSLFEKLYIALVVILGGCMAMSVVGFNITGLLTGLGLGSLTFALAAQDFAGNLVGGLTIILEHQFDIGDWIACGAIEGTVEDISFRTTKIRTFANALTIVPNSTLAGSAVTNWTRLKMRQALFNLAITYNTPRATIEKLLADVREMLETHPEVYSDTVQVRLNEFSASSLDIYVLFYVKTAVRAEYLRIREDINLKLLQIMEEDGASFAYPTQTVYMENSAAKTTGNEEKHEV